MTLTFDLLTLKVVSESRVTWAASVPILVFLGLSVLDLGPMYVIDRQKSVSDVRQYYCLMPITYDKTKITIELTRFSSPKFEKTVKL